jgi:hypothetical protein
MLELDHIGGLPLVGCALLAVVEQAVPALEVGERCRHEPSGREHRDPPLTINSAHASP